jgi:hypothetical protein
VNERILEELRRRGRQVATSTELHKLLMYDLSGQEIRELAGFAYAVADSLLTIAECGDDGKRVATWVGLSVARRLKDLDEGEL